MAVLLVLHQIKDGESRQRMARALKRHYPISFELTESTCAVCTPLLPVRVFDQIKQFVSSDDQLYVIPLSQPYVGYGPRNTTQWLSNYL